MACVLLNCASNYGCMEFVMPLFAYSTMAMHDSLTFAAEPVLAFSTRPKTKGFRCVGAK